jgi:protease I
MSTPLLGCKVAILVANGFLEDDVVSIQRSLKGLGCHYRLISPGNGLVSSWDGQSWGHHFAIDTPLANALGADYDALVIPAGQRSLDKLKLTAHTKRFISSFMQSNKPVIAMGNALHMIIFTDHVKNRTVSGPEELEDLIIQAGGVFSSDSYYLDNNLFTGKCDSDSRESFIAQMEHMMLDSAAREPQAA